MEIKLSTRQLRRLLDMVYIGNWVLNGPLGEKRIRDYDEVESLVFSCAAANGMADLAELLDGEVVPSRAFTDGGIHTAIEAYENHEFFAILAEELALRDMDYAQIGEENTDELDSRIDRYLDEFERHGTDNIRIETGRPAG